ncbi:FAD-dependent oxidoreductase [Fundidesulfovibrio butyratiphilus]
MSSNAILVVGGGFSGITAALEAAELGYEVILVEKNPYLGGRVAQLNQYFPKLCPPTCGLEIQFQRIRNNPKVKVLTLATLTKVTGKPGDFEVEITVAPRYVNEKCTSCNACTEAAVTEVECEFDFGLGKRKVAYRPNLNAFPQRYVFERAKCSEAEAKSIAAACPYGAIDLEDTTRELIFNVGAVVYATGWKPYDMAKLENLGGGKLKNVISNMQMERLCAPNGPTGGLLMRPSDGAAPKRIAFVQCAGSRDENHLNYCSYICCMASLKQACYIRERVPSADVTIFYIDLRTPGRYQKFLEKVSADPKLSLVKGKVAELTETPNGTVLATVENVDLGLKNIEEFDLVVLATGMQPAIAGETLPGSVSVDEEGFLIGGAESGFIAAGCAKLPLDVMRSAQSATGAALGAIQTVAGR